MCRYIDGTHISNFDGLGNLGGKNSIATIYNINESTLKKVIIHELTHNLGISHCPIEECFIHDTSENSTHWCDKDDLEIRKKNLQLTGDL